MPRGDCTGPLWRVAGKRGAGFCADPVMQGMGWGWGGWKARPGWGRGFRHRRWWCGFPMWKYGWKDLFSPEVEKTFLESRLRFLDEEMKAIRERLEELDKSSGQPGDEK